MQHTIRDTVLRQISKHSIRIAVHNRTLCGSPRTSSQDDRSSGQTLSRRRQVISLNFRFLRAAGKLNLLSSHLLAALSPKKHFLCRCLGNAFSLREPLSAVEKCKFRIRNRNYIYETVVELNKNKPRKKDLVLQVQFVILMGQ